MKPLIYEGGYLREWEGKLNHPNFYSEKGHLDGSPAKCHVSSALVKDCWPPSSPQKS